MIIRNGDVLTPGGAAALLNILYLVEGFQATTAPTWRSGFSLSTATAPSQMPDSVFNRERSHDVIVHQVQQHIDMHLDG